MAKPRDSLSKISPGWLNRRTKALRKRHQKHSTGKSTIAYLLLLLSPRSSRVSLINMNAFIIGYCVSCLAELFLEKGYEIHGIKLRVTNFSTTRIDHL